MSSESSIIPDRIIVAWNVGAALVTVLPLLAFMVSRLTSDGREGEDDGEGSTSWWNFWGGNNDGEQGQQDQREEGSPWWCK